MKNRTRSLICACSASLLLFLVVPWLCFSEDVNEEQSLFVVIGKIEECLRIDWREADIRIPSDFETRVLPDGTKRLTVRVRTPSPHMALVLANCDIFEIIDEKVRRIDIDKPVVLMQGKGTRIMTEKRFEEVAPRLLALDKRLLYYAKPYDVPDELIRKYGLEDTVIFQDQEIGLPPGEGTRSFERQLKKYGIELPARQKENNDAEKECMRECVCH